MEPIIFKFIPAFSYSLGVVILVTFCGPANALRCYSNGKDDFLRTDFGNIGLGECTTSGNECFEILAEPSTATVLATFMSGCDDCPDWRSFHTYECKKCKTDLCNYQLADKVRKNNRLCFQADFETELGKNAVYCQGTIDTCYAFIFFSKAKNRKVYVANCFDKDPDCLAKKDECIICNTNLCNIPADSVEAVKPFRERLLRNVAKGWGNSADSGQNPAPTAPAAHTRQMSGNSSASAKRIVSETLGGPDEQGKEDTVKRLISGGKVKNKTTSAEISGMTADLDNGSVSIQGVAAGAIDWRLRATASVALLLLAFFRELPALS